MASITQWLKAVGQHRSGPQQLPPDKRKALLTTLVLAIVLLPVMFGMASFTSRPAFCATCHEMLPEYGTWRASAHARVNCAACHFEARPTNLTHKLSALGQVYLHVTGQVPDTIRIKAKIPNEVCEACHTRQREITVAGDLNIPHARHIEFEGMACVDCHAAAAHASVSERNPGIARASVDRLRQVGSAPVAEYRPKMDACIQCHLQKQAPSKCEACHREIMTPPDHGQTGWLTSHGTAAMTDFTRCLYCHTIALGRSPRGLPVERATAIRSNEFCRSCHLQRPAGHDAGWQLGHRLAARTGRDACLVCHDAVKDPQSQAATVPACSECHSPNHPPNWRSEHPAAVERDGMKTCFTCHDAKNCSDCHDAGRPGGT